MINHVGKRGHHICVDIQTYVRGHSLYKSWYIGIRHIIKSKCFVLAQDNCVGAIPGAFRLVCSALLQKTYVMWIRIVTVMTWVNWDNFQFIYLTILGFTYQLVSPMRHNTPVPVVFTHNHYPLNLLCSVLTWPLPSHLSPCSVDTSSLPFPFHLLI